MKLSIAGRSVVIAVCVAIMLATAASAQALFRGTLIERHGDARDGQTIPEPSVLKTVDGLVPLASPQPHSLAGQLVTVNDNNPSVPGIQGRAQPLANRQVLEPAMPPGPQTVLVIILTTPDDSTPAVPDATTGQQQIFSAPNSVAAFYAQQSGGATALVGRVNPTGDVIGPIQVSSNIAGCPYGPIAAEANAAALAQGYDPAQYDHIIYLLPYTNECAWGGLGDLPGTEVWSNGSTQSSVLAHEVGHNLGAHHANLLTCTNGNGDFVPYSSSCTSSEYGDPFDVMGASGALMGAFHRDQIGELPASRIDSMRQSGTVTLTSSEDSAAPGPQLVLVPIKTPHQSVQDYWALDTRSVLSPFDTWQSSDPVTAGITIRKVNDGADPILQTQLIDMHPTATAWFTGYAAALQPGETFADNADNISITAVSTSQGLTAQVSMPTLVDDVPPTAPPSLSATASSSGVTLAWQAGTDDVAVDHYQIERDGVSIGTAGGTSFVDPNVSTLSSATYGVRTVDTSGNTSDPTVFTVSIPDTSPPTTPTGLNASRISTNSLVLAWNASSDNREVTDYQIYDNGNDLGAFSGLAAAVSRSRHGDNYTVAAEDAAGNVSSPATLTVGATSARVVQKPVRHVYVTRRSRHARSRTRRSRHARFSLTIKVTGLAPHSAHLVVLGWKQHRWRYVLRAASNGVAHRTWSSKHRLSLIRVG